MCIIVADPDAYHIICKYFVVVCY